MHDFSPCFYDFLSKPKKDRRDSICVFSPSAWHLRSSRIFKMNLAITSYFSPDLYIKLVYLLISVLIQQILLLSESFTLPPFFCISSAFHLLNQSQHHLHHIQLQLSLDWLLASILAAVHPIFHIGEVYLFIYLFLGNLLALLNPQCLSTTF